MFSKKSRSALVPASLGLLICAATVVQAATAPVLVKPEAVMQEGKFGVAFGSDSMAKISYTVKADGTTDDIEITNYLGGNQFADKALRQTVGKWTFKPATVDGKAVDYFNQELLYVTRMDPNAPPRPAAGGKATGSRQDIKEKKPPVGTAPGAAPPAPVDPSQIPLALSTKAKAAIDAAYELLKTGQNDKALETLNETAKKDLRTASDFSLVNQLKGSALVAGNQRYEALAALELATMNISDAKGEKVFFLENNLLEPALRQKFVLAATLRQNALAWDTYELIQQRFHPAADDPLHEQAKSVKVLMDSPDPLTLLAKITSGDEWSYTPTRRTFSATDVKGKLTKITAHCERRTLEMKYAPDSEVTLPASFGKCRLAFAGDEGTQFSVYEFAN